MSGRHAPQMKNSSTIITKSLSRFELSIGIPVALVVMKNISLKFYNGAAPDGFFLGLANFQRGQPVLRGHDLRASPAGDAIDEIFYLPGIAIRPLEPWRPRFPAGFA